MTKLKSVKSCDCVSGLSLTMEDGKKRSILHSVAELNNHLIIDVNYGIVMEKELYKKLFMFEELARLEGAHVAEMLSLLEREESLKVMRQFNIRDYHMAFASDDIKDFLTNKTRQTGHEVFQDLNY